MIIKATIICKDHRIVGKIDAPKIKKRLGRKHFGLLALLNHPKLAGERAAFTKDVIVVSEAQIYNHEGKHLQNEPRVHLRPDHIIAAFEEEPRERAMFEQNRHQGSASSERFTFTSKDGLRIDGEFVSEVNQIAITKGKGFISLSNACLGVQRGRTQVTYLPFIALNDSRFVHVPQAWGEEGAIRLLAKCS